MGADPKPQPRPRVLPADPLRGFRDQRHERPATKQDQLEAEQRTASIVNESLVN